MTPEQEKQLRQLLKLKRYEQPPPGYFDKLSREIGARIRAGETEKSISLVDLLFRKEPWVRRLLGAFEAKPALAGAFGALVCAMVISGIVYSENTGNEPAPLMTRSAEGPIETTGLVPVLSPVSLSLGHPGMTPMPVSSTNPVFQSGGSLFDQIRLNVQPVSGRPTGE